MGAYWKGGLAALLVLAMTLWLYLRYEGGLAVNRAPDSFNLISRMEKEGVPDFSLERFDGSVFRLSDFKGKLLVINFWASWCNPCVEEFPSLVSLAEKMGKDLLVVAVSGDEQREDIEAFAKLFGLPKPGFQILWDKKGLVRELYGASKLPETFIVNSEMKLVRKVLGTERWDSEEAIQYFEALRLGRIQ